MCRRAAFAGLLIGLAASDSLAQGESGLAAQGRRVDAVIAHWKRLEVLRRAFDDSVARRRAQMDTVRVGSLRLYVEPALRARTEAAAHVAWGYIDSVAGPAAARLARKWMVVHQLRDSTPDSLVVAAVPVGDASEYMQLWGKPDDATLAAWIRTDAMRFIALDIDRPMREWLFGEFLPDTLATGSWTMSRLNLVSSTSTVAHQCFQGDLHACAIALRLVDVADPVLEWYDAPGRQRLVAASLVERHRMNRVGTANEEACVVGNDAACIRAMHAQLVAQYCDGCTGGIADPIPPREHLSVAKLAVQMGGRDGYERLLNATGTPAQRIAAAAGLPVDTVLKAWLTKVRETRLPSDDFSLPIAASSIVWILACGFLSLRSSRWR